MWQCKTPVGSLAQATHSAPRLYGPWRAYPPPRSATACSLNKPELQLHRYGRKIDIPIGRRIFNGSFDRGGRFYCHGPSYQNMSSDERRELTLMIDGKEHPVVEIDYSTLHIAVAYSGSGKRKPRGDQHSIKGFDRCLVKLAVNILFNALTGDQARGAIAGELTRDPQLAAKSGIDSTDTKACRALAKRVVAAICRKHYRIKSYFGSDCGARFQRHDSDMAIEVMTRMMQTTKRCPLPVHDSFLVADIDADLLEETMTEVAGGHDLHLNVKRTEGAPPGPSPIWDPSLQIVNYHHRFL